MRPRTVPGQIAGHFTFFGSTPGSTWAKGMSDPSALPLDGPPKGLTDLVQPDEFPLNVFYESLRKALAPTIDSARGITGVAA